MSFLLFGSGSRDDIILVYFTRTRNRRPVERFFSLKVKRWGWRSCFIYVFLYFYDVCFWLESCDTIFFRLVFLWTRMKRSQRFSKIFFDQYECVVSLVVVVVVLYFWMNKSALLTFRSPKKQSGIWNLDKTFQRSQLHEDKWKHTLNMTSNNPHKTPNSHWKKQHTEKRAERAKKPHTVTCAANHKPIFTL